MTGPKLPVFRPPSPTDKKPPHHRVMYFPEAMLKELQAEARRQERSSSKILQVAWKLARAKIKTFPSAL